MSGTPAVARGRGPRRAGWPLPDRRLAALVLAACALGAHGEAQPTPRDPSLPDRKAERFMVSAPHPLAVETGLEILREGGNAMDAAVAVQMVLGFVEAPETGIGGGGFLLHLDGATRGMRLYDGRETAPASAGAGRFTVLGRPVPRWAAIPSGRAVGVPGLVAMLGQAHRAHGSRPWAELLAPAAALAEAGVPMPPRLRRQVARDWSLVLFADTRRHFRAQARGPEPMLRAPELARTLEHLAEAGPRAFYQGRIAAAVVDRAGSRWPWRGDLTIGDLQGYEAREREPLCRPYRGWTVCGAPPPSSGGLAVLQILGVLEHFPLGALGPGSVEAIHLLAEASRLAFADRRRYVGDPDFTEIPVEALLDRAYLRGRAALLDPGRALGEAPVGEPGRPGGAGGEARREGDPGGGTSHFTIVDGAGNVVALTSSIEAPFGARMMTGGFVLNNQLTDFDFAPGPDGPGPNLAAPGKRPRSSMSPTLVLDDQGRTRLVLGARGGSRIIGHVVKTLVAVLDWGLDVQDAIALPNVVHRGEALEIERGTALEALRPRLERLGHRVVAVPMASGLHAIERLGDGWRGGADPRLDGIARGR